jgi:hypothetical protein
MNKCKVCGSDTEFKFEKLVLNKYDVKYYQCNSCMFLQTEKVYWLNEAYSSAITKQDIGLVYRNLLYAPIVSSIIKLFFNSNKKFLDYGGGYGLFVRIMRDFGFNFYRFDTYCENIFAEGFDEVDSEKYELLTSFEVFEHLENPLQEIDKMLLKSKSILFSTELQPSNDIEKWWYVMPETGQHISLFSFDSLKFIALKYNLNLYSNGKTLHLLTDKKINSFLFKLICRSKIAKLVNLLLKNNRSFLMDDYNKLISSN